MNFARKRRWAKDRWSTCNGGCPPSAPNLASCLGHGWLDRSGILGRRPFAGYYDLALPSSEKALLARIRRKTLTGSAVTAGIGDDCAVVKIPPGHEALITTDFSLEGVHFRREWHSPEVVGHRCLTRGLSDIAAMGGVPLAAFVSLALPRKLPQSWVDGFYQGLLKLAGKFSVTLAGGDTAESPGGVLADIIVLGSVPKGRAVLRSGARVGDLIYVSGSLGGSAASLDLLLSDKRKKLRPEDFPAHFFPSPRVEVGRILREKALASAMIDISDGLSTDLAHICEESGVGAEIEASAIPRGRIGRAAPHEVDLNFALHGGDDYELLFTARAGIRVPSAIAGVPITEIGRITRRQGIILRERNGKQAPLKPQGWEHFK
jgi:thiamine-monophosphate kinase